MPYLAFNGSLIGEHTLPNGTPIVRHVEHAGQTRAVLCGGFAANDSPENAANAVAQYVAVFGGTVEAWEVAQISYDDYRAIEAAVYQPIRDAAAAAETTRKAELRALLVAQTVRVNQLVGTDRVWKVPATQAEAKEFFKAFLLALEEVREKLLEPEP